MLWTVGVRRCPASNPAHIRVGHRVWLALEILGLQHLGGPSHDAGAPRQGGPYSRDLSRFRATDVVGGLP
jgi:hypothetical protein